jgi:hypothetical protein
LVPICVSAAGTSEPSGRRSRNEVPVTPCTASLKLAVTLAARPTPVAPGAGVDASTVGPSTRNTTVGDAG